MSLEEEVAELERKMEKIREAYQAGLMTADEIQLQLPSLTIKYLDYYWTIGHQTGEWYYYIDGEWVWSESPLLVKEEDFVQVSESEIEAKVADLERSARKLRFDYETGLITQQQFLLGKMAHIINYRSRRWWIHIREDRQRWYRPDEFVNWYRRRGHGWAIKSKSPLLVSPEELAKDSSFFGVDDRSNFIEVKFNQSKTE